MTWDAAIATLVGAVSTAILMAAAYYFPRGYHRRGAERDSSTTGPEPDNLE
jgi:hypothetical protein